MRAKLFFAMLFVAAGCGGEGEKAPATPGLEGTWRGELDGPNIACLWSPSEVEMRSFDGGATHEIELSGSDVVLSDLSSSRTLTGEVTGPRSLLATWRDPTSTSVESWTMTVTYSDVAEGHARVELSYCYSRPAYGRCCDWTGGMFRDSVANAEQ